MQTSQYVHTEHTLTFLLWWKYIQAMKYIPQFDRCWLITVQSLESTGRLLPRRFVDEGEAVWRTVPGGRTGSQCSRSEAGEEGRWGDWRREAHDRLQRNTEMNGCSATPPLLLGRRRRREINCWFSQILSLPSWLIKSGTHAVPPLTNAQNAITNKNVTCSMLPTLTERLTQRGQ